jgi:hypothetical protein
MAGSHLVALTVLRLAAEVACDACSRKARAAR